MMWGKVRPVRDSDNRLRCPLEVKRKGRHERCTRLAREWSVSHQGTSLGDVVCCQAHADSFIERGFTVAVIDRRKKKESAA
jgi:hypothetical protein